MKIAIVGNGNVGTALQEFLSGTNLETVALVVRKIPENTGNLPYTTDFDLRTYTPDLVLLAVKDDAIEEVAKKLLLPENAVLVHTSGSVSREKIAPYHRNTGVFYPLQTFSKGKKTNWKEVNLFIEAGDDFSEKILLDFANVFEGKLRVINSEQRAEIHLAAVFACNFGNLMYMIADELLREKGLSFEILKPLAKETTEKAFTMPPKKAQTGPAKRGDKAVIEKHLEMLKDKPETAALYGILSNEIRKRFIEN
jgi:predicted short-subunit dehydrogenase-like oxidoreductase (DUF2520 family)